MTDINSIVEKLSLFNNRTFTRKQWEIVMEGCGCPKSSHLWTALRATCLQKYKRVYTLCDLNTESFTKVMEDYSSRNKSAVSLNYKKKVARKKAEEKRKQFKGLTFYMVGGVLTTEKPERDI